ncbi:zinc finger CCHC-type and RNA-binding motif-containing protein 1 [Exaiptasia diaphana]|uniref:Zinc finger CCHC-type and RNA-binding motif-containing protein 1 n=1 Tax=Exaiptasia diaphana TaxID=2652724 RepID=A0A913XZL7_EXADI|nr:zinc finger CCHC-type and RNA-binding motif-containing protein 1 [Exaiptasia diaphana]KXJ23737.1 Zinc finger CCHC-type and RNA-binding motif-containing protein 1 [Exaiptasia diaphana]
MSGGLAPSKSTIYVGNLPYSLTNSDLHKVFSRYGKVVKVTVMKDKVTRESKGVAFILFLDKQSAYEAVQGVNQKQMFGRTIKCCIAKDNGRTTEFIRRKEYPDKTRCYECGDSGHLSYECPKNVLGDRERPPKKLKKRKRKQQEEEEEEEEDEEEDQGEDPSEWSLGAAIEECARLAHESEQKSADDPSTSGVKKRRIFQSSYFSDDEEEDH